MIKETQALAPPSAGGRKPTSRYNQAVNSPIDDPEAFWAEVLSREPERVRQAFGPLSHEERQEVVAHLRRMSGESGWLLQQQESARAALSALGIPNPPFDGAYLERIE